MNPNHREPYSVILKAVIPERTALPEVVHINPLHRHWQTDHREIDENIICLEKIVLNSDLDFF